MRPTGGICQRACLDFFSQFDIMLLRSNAEGAVRVESRGEVLNQFLVEVFGQILKAEAACLAGKDLSLRELHLIDAVCRAVDQGGDNRSTAIAAALGITAGTLTSAVNLLEKKGYLLRRRDERDKRVVHLLPTERGRAADARHRDFHRQMVAHVLDGLTDEEAECTLRAPGRVAEFFRRGAPERG